MLIAPQLVLLRAATAQEKKVTQVKKVLESCSQLQRCPKSKKGRREDWK